MSTQIMGQKVFKSGKNKSGKNKQSKDIVTFLKQHKGKSFRRKELSRMLGISKQTYYLFREVLGELIHAGKILKLKGGKYTSIDSIQNIRGEIQITRKGFAFVSEENSDDDIFVAAQHLNTALDRDLVEVQLFTSSSGKSKEGQVVKVITRHKTTFVGTYHKSEYYGFVVPDNPKVYRDIYIPEDGTLDAKDGQKVLVRLQKWESSQLNPEGEIAEILGYPNEPGVDISSVIMGYGLPLSFPERIEEEAEKIHFDVPAEELAQRLDLRNELIFTIDPADAKDYDDAVSLTRLENGHYKLGVHIADVSFFVTEDSELDSEALLRGTSIYLVDRVIPMLPEHLSNHLCSLRPQEDKLTYSCIMEINSAGKVVDYQLKTSIIRSQKRFTYEEVQKIIDASAPNPDNPLTAAVKEMHQLSRVLRHKRFEAGSIDFDTPEVKFRLDENGKPIEIIPLKRIESNEMIEEFMLMANQTVAMHIRKIAGEHKPNPFIYRVHEKPDKDKLKRFQDLLKALGYKIQLKRNVSPRDFQVILKQIEGGKDELVIKEVALRTMMKAVYSCKSVGHFGLAFQDYSHFTSPIRRYPDLVVHRLLKEYQKPVTQRRRREIRKNLKRICDIASDRERVALEAERESIRIKQVEWLAQHQEEVFEGIISGITSFGIFVETMPYLIEGLIRLDDLKDDYYIYEEATYSLIGKDTEKRFRIGDPVLVRVSEIDFERNDVSFALVEGEK